VKVWTLLLKEKPVHRFVVNEGRPVTIGRTSEADVELDNPSISREHAVVEHEKGRDYLTDKGSTNGTWVNGKKISKRTQITDKDEIMVGKFAMVAGSVGILDVEKKGQSVFSDDDKLTMLAPSKNDSSPEKKKSSAGLGRFAKKLFGK
jgi:pSer/pThr/pTyr-binding forkhead associated (FHA) protein